MVRMGSRRPPAEDVFCAEGVELTSASVELPKLLLSGIALLEDPGALLLDCVWAAGAVVEGNRTPVGSITMPVSEALLELAAEELAAEDVEELLAPRGRLMPRLRSSPEEPVEDALGEPVAAGAEVAWAGVELLAAADELELEPAAAEDEPAGVPVGVASAKELLVDL